MKLSTREDIQAPIEHVASQMYDFDTFQRRALRQGAQVKRVDAGPVQLGSAWETEFTFRGRERQLLLTVTQFDPQAGYTIVAASKGIDITIAVDLIELSRSRTRLAVAVEMRAKSMTARLLLQSMKLAKNKITKRFKERVFEMAETIESGYRKSA